MGNMLSKIFDPGSIRLNLDGKTKEMVIADLIDAIAALHPQCGSEEIFAAIREREEKMSTGIGCGIAIPHAVCRGLANTAGAIGVSQNGIDFGALDGNPVHVVFLLALNDSTRENHLRVLNAISGLAQSEVIEMIKNAKNAQDIHAILSKAK